MPRAPLPTASPVVPAPAIADNDSNAFAPQQPQVDPLATVVAPRASAPHASPRSTRAVRNLPFAPPPRRPPPTRDEPLAENPAPAASSEQLQASQDFAAAMKSLAGGDFNAAGTAFEQFVSVHSHDARVEDALYLEAIAFERAGRLDAAKAVAKRYIAVYPSGAHIGQVRRLVGD